MQSFKVHRIIVLAWLVLGCGRMAYAMPGAITSAPPAYRFQSTSSAFSPRAVQIAYVSPREYAPAGGRMVSTPITYNTSSVTPMDVIMGGGSSHTGSSGGGSVRSYAPAFSSSAAPSFRFQTTSAFLSPDNDTPSGITMGNRAPQRRAGSWDDPEDDPIGGVPDPLPVGEPLVLAVMAMLYGVVIYLRRRRMMSNQK